MKPYLTWKQYNVKCQQLTGWLELKAHFKLPFQKVLKKEKKKHKKKAKSKHSVSADEADNARLIQGALVYFIK